MIQSSKPKSWRPTSLFRQVLEIYSSSIQREVDFVTCMELQAEHPVSEIRASLYRVFVKINACCDAMNLSI